MDNLKQSGKILRKTDKETDINIRRISERYLKPERAIGLFNKIHPYFTEFKAEGNSVLLNLKFSELVIPCTVNPPRRYVRCWSSFQGDNPGEFSDAYPFQTTTAINPPLPDYTKDPTGIYVPLDGCYDVLWQSAAWGPSYFPDKTVTMAILHNDAIVRVVTQRTTGILIVLGPSIFMYTPASPVYAVIECKAGDKISAFITQESIDQGYPWIGQPTGLHGFFASTGWYGSSVEVELIAEAEV